VLIHDQLYGECHEKMEEACPTGASIDYRSRRYHDLVVRHVEDLGGYDLMSEAQLSMIRRAAAIECELERLDGLLSNGIEINLDMYSRCAGHLRRMFETLGIERLDRLKAVTARSPLEAKGPVTCGAIEV
jgi:hypothetical protein